MQEMVCRDIAQVEHWFYQNPLPVRGIGDPFILPVSDGYALFATGNPQGFSVWKSPDLRDFRDRRLAMGPLSWASDCYWAPEAYAYQGRYVLLFSARRASDQSLRVGIAFADRPEGPYEDPLGSPLFDFGYAAIDASLLVDGDGTPYLYYARDCSENVVEGRHESHLYGVRLSPDLLRTEGEPVLLTRPEEPWEFHPGEEWRWNEGPSVLRHEGRYWLFFSAHAFWDKHYSVGAAVADAPLGPYVKQPGGPMLPPEENDLGILVSGPGHNAYFQVGEELFTAYHTHTYPAMPSGNRQLNIDRAGWFADGPAYISGPTLTPQLLPLTQLGLREWGKSAGGEGVEALFDGDVCPREARRKWRGRSFGLTWSDPPQVELLMLYPSQSAEIRARLILNEEWELPIDLRRFSGLPGEALRLLIPPVALRTLRFETLASEEGGEAPEVSLNALMIVGK